VSKSFHRLPGAPQLRSLPKNKPIQKNFNSVRLFKNHPANSDPRSRVSNSIEKKFWVRLFKKSRDAQGDQRNRLFRKEWVDEVRT